MSNYSLVVMVAPATHDLSYNVQKEAGRYRRGDIVDIVLTSKTQAPNVNGRLGYIHITGVPNRISLARAKEVLLSLVTIDDPDYVNSGLDIDIGQDVRQLITRTRQWRIPVSLIPLAKRQAMLNNREFTVNWATVKPYIRKKIVADRLNAAQDNEDTALVENDI
jgi:hypothetical protein